MYLINRAIVLRKLRHNLVSLEVSKRGIRAVKRIPRSEVPRYKKDLGKLPPLTQLLTNTDEVLEGNNAIRLRIEKLKVYKQYLPVGSNTNLIEALFNQENDIDRLLNIIDDNLETMTSFYLGVSFEVLSDMVEAKLCDPATIMVSPEFKKLCKKTLYKLRFFEADEVLKLIKCLSYLGLPENTLLVQASFTMTRHLINDFTIPELEALSASLDKFKPLQTDNKGLLCALKSIIPAAKNRKLEEKQSSSMESHLLNS